MSLKSKVVNKLNELVDKAKDEKTRERVKAEVTKHLQEGKDAISRLQAEINKPAYRVKAAEQIKRATDAMAHLKKEAVMRQRQELSYAKKNPEKSLVIAVTAGAAAVALL